MSPRRQRLGRGRDRLVRAQSRLRSAALPLRERVDVVLLSGLAAALLVLGAAAYLALKLRDRFAASEGDLVEPIADERLLVNVHDDLRTRGILDAAWHPGDGHLYLSQEGGVFHRYQPRTGLWSSERPFEERDPIDLDFVALRAGDGADPFSRAVIDPGDEGYRSLWALSGDGGLARRLEDHWDIVISNSAFKGLDGETIEDGDLTNAAASSDGIWLAVGTRADGLGIYHIPTRQWLVRDPDFIAASPAGPVKQLVWWRGRFWFGGPNGLASWDPSAGKVKPSVRRVDGPSMDLLDLDADPDGGLWILAETNCLSNGSACLWLARINEPDEKPEILLDEQNVYPELNLADLHFAQQDGDFLYLAGIAGIFSYDARYHSWKRHFSEPVSVTLPFESGDGFYFGFAGGLGFIQNNRLNIWRMDGAHVKNLVAASREQVFAVTTAGTVYVMEGRRKPKLVFEAPAPGPEVHFDRGIALDDIVLLLGPSGGLLHDVRQRTYLDLLPDTLPSWLRRAGVRLVFSGGTLFVLSPAGDLLEFYALSREDLLVQGFGKAQKIAALKGWRDYEIRRWDEEGIAAFSPRGPVFLISKEGMLPIKQGSAGNLEVSSFNDVTAVGTNLAVAAADGLYHYNLQNREWARLSSRGFGAEQVAEISSFQNRLLMRTADGRLFHFNEKQMALSTASHVKLPLIGDEVGFAMSDEGLSDALLEESRLYLAGEGKIDCYDTELRRILDRWQLPVDGPIMLVGIFDKRPVSLAHQSAYLGDQVIDPQAGPVLNLALKDDALWAVRRGSEGAYLIRYPLKGQAQPDCLFRNPVPDSAVTRLVDACAVGNLLAVTTDAAVHFYDPRIRSWYPVRQDWIAGGGRVYRVDRELVLTARTDEGLRLSRTPIDDISLPKSCETSPALLKGSGDTLVRAAALEPQQGAALLQDGSVVMLARDKGEVVRLGPTEPGPATAGFRRVYRHKTEHGDFLLFTGDAAIYRYDLKWRHWQEVAIELPDRAIIADMNIETAGKENTVILRLADGRFFRGSFDEAATLLKPRQMFNLHEGRFGYGADTLVGVHSLGTQWVFLLKDRVRYYDPNDRLWLADVPLESAGSGLTFCEAAGNDVVIGDQGKDWWVALGYREGFPTRYAHYRGRSGDAHAIDGDQQIWSLSPDGRLSVAPAPETGDYAPPQPSGPPPFYLDPGAVSAAYVWQERIVFETAAGLRVFDPASDAELTLPAQAAGFTGVLLARRFDNDLLLYNGRDLLMLSLATSDRVQTRLFPGVTRLIQARTGTPWIEQNGGWRVWRETDFQPPHAAGGLSLAGWELYLLDGATPAAVAADGRLYYWSDGFRQAGSLPAGITRTGLRAPIRDADDAWWFLCAGELLHRGANTATAPGVAGRWPLPADFTAQGQDGPVRVRMLGLGLEIVAGNVGLRLTDAGDGYVMDSFSPSESELPTRVADEWADLKENCRTLAGGLQAYNPIESLAVNEAGELEARRPSGADVLAARGSTAPVPARPLDVGWLVWDGAERRFLVNGPTGPMGLPVNRFIRDGRLVFEDVDALLESGNKSFHAANAYGVFKYSLANLSLTDASITYQPLALSAPMLAAHGRFYTAGAVFVPGSQAPNGEARAVHTERLGDVTIAEDVVNRRLAATISANGGRIAAFDTFGFTWDQDRRALAFDGENLLLQSRAGIHPVEGYRGFDLGPNQAAADKGTLWSEAGMGVFFQLGTRWFHRQGKAWRETPDPTANRIAFTDGTWTWEVRAGEMQVSFNGLAFDPPGMRSDQRFGFSADHLLDATVFDDRLFVISEAFLEIANKPEELGRRTATTMAAMPVDSLRRHHLAGGGEALALVNQRGTFYWNTFLHHFQRQKGRDDGMHTLVATDWLKLVRDPDTGLIEKRFKLQRPGGAAEWQTFRFSNKRFPFDVVTAVEGDQQNLLVGTELGLGIYDGGRGTGLGDLRAFVHMGADPSGPPMPVNRIGRPAERPGQMLAASARTTLAIAGDDVQVVAPAQGLQGDLIRIDTPLWQWVRKADGTVEGRYQDPAGNGLSEPIHMTGGLFPHDRVTDIAMSGGRALSLWENGWISRHPNHLLRLDMGFQNFSLTGNRPRRFITLAKDLALTNGTLARGVYVQGDGDGYWFFNGSGWVPIGDAEAAVALAAYRDEAPIYSHESLRLAPSASGHLRFEQRSLDGAWRPLPWQNGRVAIDQWEAVVEQGETLWAATSVGFAGFSRDRLDQAVLDPDHFILVAGPPGLEGANLTDIALVSDQVHLRYDMNSDKVFSGVLDGTRDRLVFTQTGGRDSFAERTLISPADGFFWEWRLSGRRHGKAGYLSAVWRGEELSLVGGKFLFDTISGLAFFGGDEMEIASEAGGWYRCGRQRLDVVGWRRPQVEGIDPADVVDVGLTMVAGETRLGLKTTSGDFIRLAPDGTSERTKSLLEYQGEDGLWRYWRDGSRLIIGAADQAGGTNTRSLVDGRFGDDWVIGLPIPDHRDGRLEWLVPTRAGVVRLDRELHSLAVQPPPFAGLPAGKAPAVLFKPDAETVIYAGSNAFYRLEGAQEEVARLDIDAPALATLRGLVRGDRDALQIQWEANGRRGWNRLRSSDYTSYPDSAYFINLAAFDKFVERRIAWGDPSPWMTVAFDARYLDMGLQGFPRRFRIHLPRELDLVAPMLAGERLLLIGRHDLLEVDLNRVLGEIGATLEPQHLSQKVAADR